MLLHGMEQLRIHGLDNSEKYKRYHNSLRNIHDRLAKHPMLLLLKEYRLFQHTMISFCDNMCICMRRVCTRPGSTAISEVKRVMGYVNSLGTETGRVIITQPNLQMVSLCGLLLLYNYAYSYEYVCTCMYAIYLRMYMYTILILLPYVKFTPTCMCVGA